MDARVPLRAADVLLTGTITKEWRAAQAKNAQERSVHAVVNHKPGNKVTYYEPSIVSGEN